MPYYTTVLFQTKPGAFADDGALDARITAGLGHGNFQLQRENYEDGAWSGWFSLTAEANILATARTLEKTDGISNLTLKDNTGAISPLGPDLGPRLHLGGNIGKPPKP